MIEELTVNQFDRVAPIYDLCRRDELDTIDTELDLVPWQSDDYIQSVVSESRIFVFQEFSCIKGFCGVHDGKLNWLFVLKRHRGEGIASALVTKVTTEYDAVSLTVALLNKPALRLYESLGFKVTREFDVIMQGKSITVLNMST